MTDGLSEVKELDSSSMIDKLIINEMLIHLNSTSLAIVMLFHLSTYYLFIHHYSGFHNSIKWIRFPILLSPYWFREESEEMKCHLISPISLLSLLLKWGVVHSFIVIQLYLRVWIMYEWWMRSDSTSIHHSWTWSS